MPRTTASAVAELMTPGGDYVGDGSDLDPYILTASELVNELSVAATESGFTVGAARLELIERWLSAHVYQQSDPGYTTRSEGGASGNFTGQFDKGLESTRYGSIAKMLDTTGLLGVITSRKVAGGFWSGKSLPDQLSYEQRN